MGEDRRRLPCAAERVHVHIDEPGGDHLAGGIERSSRGRVYSPGDGRDFVTANANVGSEPGTARAVDDAAVSDDEVVGGDLRPEQNDGSHHRERHPEGKRRESSWSAHFV